MKLIRLNSEVKKCLISLSKQVCEIKLDSSNDC